MPQYEFKCVECGDVREQKYTIKGKPIYVNCACGGVMKSIISKSTFHLKGSGWAKDGYGKKK